jgi:hypothetical protein
MLIVPFALESTGFLHPKSVDFLQDLADIADETQKLGSENMMTFFVALVLLSNVPSPRSPFDRRN